MIYVLLEIFKDVVIKKSFSVSCPDSMAESNAKREGMKTAQLLASCLSHSRCTVAIWMNWCKVKRLQGNLQMGKTFASHIPDKALIYRVYKELLPFNSNSNKLCLNSQMTWIDVSIYLFYIPEVNGGDGYPTIWMHLMPLICTIKNDWKINFILCVLLVTGLKQ